MLPYNIEREKEREKDYMAAKERQMDILEHSPLLAYCTTDRQQLICTDVRTLSLTHPLHCVPTKSKPPNSWQ